MFADLVRRLVSVGQVLTYLLGALKVCTQLNIHKFPMFWHRKTTLQWGTKADAARLGVEPRTRYWAHAWVRERMAKLPLSTMVIVDAGSGTSNPLLDWYRPQVKYAYLLDRSNHLRGANWELINCDLEKALPFPDNSVDLVTSVSSIEHLSAEGQLLFMQEAHRVLKRRSHLVMTVSYVCGLTAEAIQVLASDPVIAATGCQLTSRLNLREMLRPFRVEPPWFTEEWLLSQPDIILDYIGSYGNVRCLPEVDAMRLPWAELGIHLIK